MGLRIRHIATRFALILAAAAAVPLIGYGVASIRSLQQGTHDSIVTGNSNVATRAAEEIRRYVTTNAELLKAVAADLQDTGLQTWQQDRILKNDVLQFREFREITLFDEAGTTVATSRAGQPRVALPAEGSAVATFDGAQMSAIHVDADLLPTAVFAIHLKRLNMPNGWLVGEFSLEEMWRMVDAIRIPVHGYALVVDPSGTLVAHGDPDKKALVAQAKNLSGQHPLVGHADASPSAEYVDASGRRQLAVAAPIPQLNWTVIVEQPTAEAYAAANILQRQLIVAIAIALLAMIAAGLVLGRRFIAPIFLLQRGTQRIAEGNLDTRVTIPGEDEFHQLGDAFNSMASRLAKLQTDLLRAERETTFVKVARGLVHDLKQPLASAAAHAALLGHPKASAEDRPEATRLLTKSLRLMDQFITDLRATYMKKPENLVPAPVHVNQSLRDVLELMEVSARERGVIVETAFAREPLVITAQKVAFERVCRNLMKNALDAMPGGGTLRVSSAVGEHRVQIVVADTGCGIAPDNLAKIFDEFMTTKEDGLGIGLALSKRFVEDFGGTIGVESEVGRGTAFTMRFPAGDDAIAEAS
jgi:signal transduction histidine kinase